MMALGAGDPSPEVGYSHTKSTEKQTYDDNVYLIGPHHAGHGSPVINWRRCVQQPPWWAWCLVVIGICLLGLLIIHMAVTVTMTSTSLADTQSADMDVRTGFKDCKEVYDSWNHTSGIYTVSPDGVMLIDVYCEQQLDGGAWTVFQVRNNGSVDFSQDWYSYRTGFGDLLGEFWLGNQNIYHLTKHHDQQLKVELTHPDEGVRYADYKHFWLADETYQYTLYVAGYTGGTTPGDSLAHHSGSRFSTRDQNNDPVPRTCTGQQVGGWWYHGCNWANLNAHYGSDSTGQNGMFWWSWKPQKNMIATRMMFRRRP